jgi:hypothetical protein
MNTATLHIDFVHLETLRNRSDRRLNAVATVRMAQLMDIQFQLLAGPCRTVGTSQEARPDCTGEGVYRAKSWLAEGDVPGRRMNYCEGCMRRALHAAAFWHLRHGGRMASIYV